MRKRRWSKVSGLIASSVLAVGLLAGCGGDDTAAPTSSEGAGDSGEKVIKIGGIFDETGATGDVGAPYADGARAFFEHLNSTGGVDGYKIDLIGEDYAYDISRAQQVYQSLRDRHKVAAIIGWGTGDTEALRSQIIADELPYFSGSLSENLKSTTDSAYNYLSAASYSDQGRATLDWIVENHKGDFPVDVTLVFHKGHPFSESPMQDIKDYAAENYDGKINMIPDLEIEFGDQNPQTTIQAWLRSNSEPDYAIINYTWGQTRNVVRDAKKLGWETQFIGLNWTAGEGIIPEGDDNQQWVDALEGFMAVVTHALPSEDLPGMAPIKEYLDSKGKTTDDINQKFVQGWATAAIYAEAMKIAIEQTGGEVTGSDVKAAIESIDNLDLGGLAANVTFSPEKHYGTKEIRLGQLKDGKWVIVTDYFGVE